MLRRYFTALLVILLALGLVPGAAAQDYSFSVDKEVAEVYWNSDGTMSLDYLFTITNNGGAHVIDFYDVGLPSSDFDLSSIKADVNGVPVGISTSDYLGSGPGVSVDLGSQTIQPGQSGTIHINVGRISSGIYVDNNDPNYASAVFAPTFIGRQYLTGSTDLTVTFHLPPGIKPEEPRWHDAPSGFPSEPETGQDAEGRVTYTWQDPSANGYTPYQFGASFPSSYIPPQAVLTEPPPAPASPVNVNFDWLGNLFCFGIFGFFFLGIPLLTALQGQRRKLQYMPPRIAIEGHGIKRGLTAVEAAVLMEQPLDKVMTMILFGTIKKNAAKVLTRDPLEIETVSPVPEGLHEYELSFLKAFQAKDKKERQRLLQDTMISLVKQVSEKMRGFSRGETIDYYKSIMERAWQQIEAGDTPEVKSQKLDEGMEWTMLDRDYDGRMQRTFRGPIFVPTWWGHYDPTFHPTSLGGSGKTSAPSLPSSGSHGPSALPGADFAASVVGGVQGFSSRVLGDLNTFTGRITGVTNPPPKPSVGSSTRGGGGGRAGGGCACACACAGCACACAGGGR
jgi:hypothetical protein